MKAGKRRVGQVQVQVQAGACGGQLEVYGRDRGERVRE